jgi:hypothetical protein
MFDPHWFEGRDLFSLIDDDALEYQKDATSDLAAEIRPAPQWTKVLVKIQQRKRK